MKQSIKYVFALLTAVVSAQPTLSLAQSTLLDSAQAIEQQIDQMRQQGKWLIVMFWASDCHICNHEAPELADFHKKNHTSNAQIVGVSLDGKRKQNAADHFIRKHGVTFPNYVGEPRDVFRAFYNMSKMDFVGTPTFLVFSDEGKPVAYQVGERSMT